MRRRQRLHGSLGSSHEDEKFKNRAHYRRFVGYLKRNYPTIITIGRLARWGLTTLKNTLFGIGGISLLVIAGLYIAGALIEPVRWYLVGIASALLLLCSGLLALSYARLWLNRFTSDQGKQVSDVRKQVSNINKQVSDIKKALRTSEAELKKEISDSKNTLAKMNVGNFPLFQPLNRQLTNDDLKRFAGEWVPNLGLDLDARALAYIAHRICLAEDTCVGRLAGNIETMLLRVLVARSVMEPNLEVLEIGTLFGVGAAMIHENCRGFFNNVHISVIDPLSGYYGRDNLDVIIKMPVTRDIFVHNMQRMNIPKSDYTIIEKLSTEDEAIEQASKGRYNLLIIDGDHSYFGVKHDFNNYRHLVKRGGYIVFDDYNNPRWPELTDFVDKEVAGMPGLEFVGTDVYTAVFKVIAPQDLAKQSATTVTTTTKDESSAGPPSPALTGRDTAPNPPFDYPKQVSLETSSTCNAHCDFCPQSKLARRGHIMQMGLIEKVISELAEFPPDCPLEVAPNGVNEPLADKRIFDILDLISSKLPSARIYFITNGNLLSEEAIAELSKHNLSRLCISLNFCDKKTYEQRTGLQWEKTLAAMSILHEKASSGEFRHPVYISRVQDESEYDTVFTNWVEVNYAAFRYWLKKFGNWLGAVPNLPHRTIKKGESKCPQWYFMHIASTGVVQHCCMDGDVEYPWGNVKTMKLLDIFNQAEWLALRRGQRSRFEIHPCNKCTYLL